MVEDLSRTGEAPADGSTGRTRLRVDGGSAFSIYSIGAMLIGAAVIVSQRWPGSGSAFQPSEPFGHGWIVLLAFIPYAWVARTWLRSGGPSRWWLWTATIGIGSVFVVAPPIQSHDVYQ